MFYVPMIVSLVMGARYVLLSAGHPWAKAAAVLVFTAAVVLQFFSPYVLAGLFLQLGLAMVLELRRLYWEGSYGSGDFPA